MKKQFLFCIIILLFAHCRFGKELTYQSKSAFMEAFKTSALYGCLNASTQGEFSNALMKYNDLGLAAQVAVLYHAETAIARELGEEFSKTIEPHYYYEGQFFIYNDCVQWAIYGKQVDSIAKAIYRRNKYSKLQYRDD